MILCAVLALFYRQAIGSQNELKIMTVGFTPPPSEARPGPWRPISCICCCLFDYIVVLECVVLVQLCCNASTISIKKICRFLQMYAWSSVKTNCPGSLYAKNRWIMISTIARKWTGGLQVKIWGIVKFHKGSSALKYGNYNTTHVRKQKMWNWLRQQHSLPLFHTISLEDWCHHHLEYIRPKWLIVVALSTDHQGI